MKADTVDEEIKTPFTVDELRGFIDQALPKFEPIWKEGQDNERRWFGQNYTEKQEKTIRSQGRQPYSFGQARTKVNRIIGIQADQKTQFDVVARADPNDEVKAELAKLQLHGIEKRSEFPDLEEYVFTAGLGIQYGVSKMIMDYSDITPRVACTDVDYLNFMWDPNCRAYNLNDKFQGALWVCEIDNEYRKVLEQKYNYKSTLVNDLKEGTFGSTFKGREKLQYYVQENNHDHEYDIISIFSFYIKAPRTFYYIVFPDTQELFKNRGVIHGKYTDEDEANEKLRELQLQYLINGFDIEGSVESKKELAYDKYEFTYDKILNWEKTDLEMFPYDLFRAIHFGDGFCSFMDILKDPQKWYDRFIMQIDYALGKDNKVAKELDVTSLALDYGETPDSALRKIEEGKTILKRGNGQALSAVEMKGVSPQWFQILDIITMVFEDLAQGQQFQAKSNAADSGKKVEALIAQGGLGVKPFFNNLRKWKKGVGKNMISWMKRNETAQDVIRVQGGALTPQMIELLKQDELYQESPTRPGDGFITINKGGLSYLNDADIELEVTQEALSDSEKQGKLQNALEWTQKDPLLQQSLRWREYLLTLSPIPENIKYDLIDELKGIQQRSAEATAAEQKMKQDELNIKKAEVINRAPVGTFAQS